MASCPNINLSEWKELVAKRGETLAYYLWDKYEGDVPSHEYNPSIIKSGLKSIEILNSVKATNTFNTLTKNKVTGDTFWKKLQQDLSIPKEQIDILKLHKQILLIYYLILCNILCLLYLLILLFIIIYAYNIYIHNIL